MSRDFAIDRHNVTNGDYLEFVDATGADGAALLAETRTR